MRHIALWVVALVCLSHAAGLNNTTTASQGTDVSDWVTRVSLSTALQPVLFTR
jgi:hypothetical protein